LLGPDPVSARFSIVDPNTINVWILFDRRIDPLPSHLPSWVASYNGWQYDAQIISWTGPGHKEILLRCVKSAPLPPAKTVFYRALVPDLSDVEGNQGSPFLDFPMFGP